MRGNPYGNLDLDDIFDSGDLAADWIDFKRGLDKSDETLELLRVRLRENEAGTALQQYFGRNNIAIPDAAVSDMINFRDYLREEGLADSTIVRRLSSISELFSVLMLAGIRDGNPAGFVLTNSEFDPGVDRNHVTVVEIAAYIATISSPQYRAIAICLAKWGLRRGEVVNIDLSCLHIDDPRYRTYLDEQGIELVDEITDRPDSLYVYGDYCGGDMVNGEKRKSGTRSERATILPIDAETKYALLEWLTMRPRSKNGPHPLFVSEWRRSGTYDRITGQSVYNKLIREHAVDFGIASIGNDHSDVDIHFFRHFFRTQMKRHWGDHDGALDDDLIKYLRGDVVSDRILRIYQQDGWGVNTRKPYLNNIYTFGLYDW